MRYLELMVRLATRRTHLDVSVTPFVWQFKFERKRTSSQVRGLVAIGPIMIDWTRFARA